MLVDILSRVSNNSVRRVGCNVTYLDDGVWNQVPDTKVLLQEQADLGGADIVLDDLADHPDVVLVLPKRSESLVDVGPGTLNDEGTVLPKNDIQVLRRPESGLAHRHDEIGTGKERDASLPPLPIGALNAPQNGVDLVVEVAQDLGGGHVLRLALFVAVDRLERVDHEPGRLLDGP